MSTPPGYGPVSGIPGGDDPFEAGPAPAPTRRGPEPVPEHDDARERVRSDTAERRSRPVDSGIPTPSLDEDVLGPARAFADEPFADVEPDSDHEPPGSGPGGRRAALLLVMGAAGVLLVVAAQAAAFVNAVSAWPPVLRWMGYAVAGGLGAMFVGSAAVLAWRYVVLPVTPGLRLDRADDLAHRRSVQLQARRNVVLARRRLGEFLDRYPTDPKHRRYLASVVGGDRDEARARVDRLLARRDRLRTLDVATDADWVRDFEDRFLTSLDELAAAMVTRHAVAVGWKTAVVPTGFLDALIVAANAYHLVGGLCRLYHLRADSWSTLKISAHVFVNTFVASRLDDLAGAAADEAFDHMHGLIGAQLARMALSRVSSGVTQGTVNALLLRRFGRFAVRTLRPIRP